jgi:hypothetical protein
MLTFEFSAGEDETLELHGDREGLLRLASILTQLAESEEPDHVHLMTPDWGDTTLSAEPQGINATLFKHVKVCVWPIKRK